MTGATGGGRLAVAMCTYNGERHVAEELDSFVQQTRLPDELVVCDDRSTDGTVEIVEAFAERAPFEVRLYVNDENLGYTKNLERAISLTTGDFVALADWDDVWMPQKVGRLVDAFTNSPTVGLVLSDAEIVTPDLQHVGSLWDTRGWARRDRFLAARGHTHRLLRKNFTATYGTTMALRSTLRDAVLPLPDRWVSTTGQSGPDAWIALIAAGLSDVAFIDEPLVKYRQHATNMAGAGSTSLLTRLRSARANTAETFTERAERLRLGVERLTALGARPGYVRHVRRAERHVRFRAAPPASYPARLASSASELARLRYHRYSDGWRSLASDVLLR
ncbi:MAG: glycosyltransferase family 2 protein [Actinomycetota bacterium]|nr:glycosyltransferase family 2 protein [Actinomycetota bacterium]